MSGVDWKDLGKDFLDDTDVFGAFQRLAERSTAVAETKARLALTATDDPSLDLVRGDAFDAQIALEQQIQHEIVNLGSKAIEWIPKILTTILAAYL